MRGLTSFQVEEILRAVRGEHALPLDGIHGEAHWLRVRENGLALAEETGADPVVVEWFALLHDSKRRTNGRDPGHGLRAARFARDLSGRIFNLSPTRLDLLHLACRDHDAGLVEGHVTVRTCWDADRLDLGRCGIVPDPALLCTEAARRPETIRRAYRRSRERS
jgi:uncharacterized protein